MFALFATLAGIATAVMAVFLVLSVAINLLGGKNLVDDHSKAMSFVTMAFAFAAIAFHFLV